MEKITVKELVDFKRQSTDKSKKSFALRLKNRKAKEIVKDEEDENTGGDYWKTSTSCIYNVIKYHTPDCYEKKIDELVIKINKSDFPQTKKMFQRNIDIINSFKDFQVDHIRPVSVEKFETVHKSNKILDVENFPLYLNPDLIFSFEKNGKNEIGAIWLVPKLYGYKKQELGMFCETLHRFLTKHYSDKYQISDDLCVAVDTYKAQKVAYKELATGQVPYLVENTLQEIRNIN